VKLRNLLTSAVLTAFITEQRHNEEVEEEKKEEEAIQRGKLVKVRVSS